MISNRKVSFSNELKDKDLTQLFKDMISFSDRLSPLSKYTPNISKVKQDRYNLFVDSYLNTLNRIKQNKYVIANTPKNELKINKEILSTSARFLLPYNNEKYSNNTITKVLEIHKNLNIFTIVEGKWDSKNPDNSIATHITTPNVTRTNNEFIAYLYSKYNRDQVVIKLHILAMLHSDLGFHKLFRRYDWKNLKNEAEDIYYELQAQITQKENYEANSLKHLSKTYVGSRATKDIDKQKESSYICNEEDALEVKKINRLFPKELQKYFSYSSRSTAYNDIDSCKKVFGTNEVIEQSGGRLFSLFNYGLKKDVRNWLMDSINYVEIDMVAMLVNSLYLYETGSLIDERVYNKVARQILKDKKTLKESDIEFATPILANLLKTPILLSLNNYDKKTTSKKIFASLMSSKILTTVKSELLKEYDECMLDTAQKELGFTNETLSVEERNKNKQFFKTGRRNINFLNKHGETEDNIKFLEILGHNEITVKTVLRAINKSIPELRQYAFRLNSLETQSIESNVIKSLTKYMRKDRVLPFLVHDCIYVPKDLENKYHELFIQHLTLETINYKATRLSYLYDIKANGSEESLNTFLTTVENIYEINKSNFRTKDTFKAKQKRYSYITSSVIGNNSKRTKNIFNQSIWSTSDLNTMEFTKNLSSTSVESFKAKFKEYVKSDSSFRLHKALASLYLYSFYTGEYLFSLSELNLKDLVVKDFYSLNNLSNTKDKLTNKKKSNNTDNEIVNKVIISLILKDKKKLNIKIESIIRSLISKVNMKNISLKKEPYLSSIYLSVRPKIRGIPIDDS